MLNKTLINVQCSLLALAITAAPLIADDIKLKGGGKLTGLITEETEEEVTIDIGAGTMTVKKSTVVAIERGTSPLQEYRARARITNPNDVEGWRKLGRWATDQGLSAQAHEAYNQVRAGNPNDEEANRAVGNVLHDGRWIPEAQSYEARGFVKFENEWMRPEERATIVREREAKVAENRSAVAGLVKESEAHRKQLEDEERLREEEEERRNRLPMVGDPLHWGYGSYWPN